MAKRLTAAQKRRKDESYKAIRNIAVIVLLLSVVGYFWFRAVASHRSLDKVTLCPVDPGSVAVLLVDVTDPMNLPQRQDFSNQLDRLIDEIPRYGKLTIAKVDPVGDRLLTPVITRCNPGSGRDVSDVDGNPAQLQKMRQEQFLEPLRASLDSVLAASGAKQSPILETIQSVNLTELQRADDKDTPKRLIIASDLLQNTGQISFYGTLPDARNLTGSQQFSRVRTDLRGVEIDLWMLQRDDSTTTQPRALPDLWERIIDEQGGKVMRVYVVSG